MVLRQSSAVSAVPGFLFRTARSARADGDKLSTPEAVSALRDGDPMSSRLLKRPICGVRTKYASRPHPSSRMGTRRSALPFDTLAVPSDVEGHVDRFEQLPMGDRPPSPGWKWSSASVEFRTAPLFPKQPGRKLVLSILFG